jgi:hypothetical protein
MSHSTGLLRRFSEPLPGLGDVFKHDPLPFLRDTSRHISALFCLGETLFS